MRLQNAVCPVHSGLAALVFCSSLALGASNVSGTPVNITAMHLVRPSVGWVQSGPHVYWTADNGNSWSEITPKVRETQEIQRVFFLDDNHGWIALDDLSDSALSPFSIASTSNGGKTWRFAVADLSNNPMLPELKAVSVTARSLEFIDPQHGWVMYRLPTSTTSNLGILFRTEDGGVSWTLLNAPPMAGELSFSSSSTGLVYGSQPSKVDMEVWYTADAGSHWQQAPLPLPAKCSATTCTSVTLGPAHWEGGQEALLSSVVSLPDKESYASFMYKSDTAGRTWAIDATSLTSGANEFPHPTSLFDGQMLRVVEEKEGEISVQIGGAKSSLQLPEEIPSRSSVSEVSFVDSANGWILVRGMSCAAGFHVPCMHPEQQALHEDLVSVSGGSLKTITPSSASIVPNADGAGNPMSLQKASASDAEAMPQVVSGPVRGSAKAVEPDGTKQVKAAAIGLRVQQAGEVNGFDGLNMAGTLSTSNKWQGSWNWSPYFDSEAYIGGINRKTGVVSSSQVGWMLDQGWGVAPIYVGYQSACADSLSPVNNVSGESRAIALSRASDSVQYNRDCAL